MAFLVGSLTSPLGLSYLIKQLRSFISSGFFVFIATILAVIFYPVIVFFLTPILIYRQIVKKIVLIQDKKCGEMLSGMNAVMAADCPYTKPLVVLAPYWTFTLKVDRSQILKVINQQIIEPNLYPELKQRIVRKFGYYFRYPVDRFDVEHHVKYLFPDDPEKPVTRRQLRRLGVEKVGKIPMNPNYSPWDIIIVPNLIDENNPAVKSAVFVRANHCLMDGYSLVNFTRNVAIKRWDISVAQAFSKNKNGRSIRSTLKDLFFCLKVLFFAPFYIIKAICYDVDNTEFLKKALNPSTKEEEIWGVKEVEPCRMDGRRLKKLKSTHNVSLSSLMLTLSVEAIIKFIKTKCDNGFSKIPNTISMYMSFPLPGRTDAMTNHWTMIKLPITVNEEDDPLKTLKWMNNRYEYFKTSVVPLTNLGIPILLGFLPVFLFPNFEELAKQTIALANMPGPSKKADMFGYEWEGCNLSGSPAKGSAFVVAVQSYLGKLWIDIGGVGTLLQSQEDTEQLEEYMFDVLHQLEAEGAAMKNNN